MSVKDSQACWEKFHSKRKKAYNECTKNAVISFHVFCEGKKALKDYKKNKLKDCQNIFDPKELYQCRDSVYREMNTHIKSLEQWIYRERNIYLDSLK